MIVIAVKTTKYPKTTKKPALEATYGNPKIPTPIIVPINTADVFKNFVSKLNLVDFISLVDFFFYFHADRLPFFGILYCLVLVLH